MRAMVGGGIVPSHFKLVDSDDTTAKSLDSVYRNDHLIMGYTVGIHFPGDPDYIKDYPGATYITYDVFVPYTNGSFGHNPKISYCRLAYPLGSPSDPTTAVLRTPKGWDGTLTDDFYNSTTAVLVLFQDGSKGTPWIIATADPKNKVDDKADGYHFKTRYNGIETNINKDGEYTLTSTLETVDVDTNKVTEPDAAKAGTFFKIDKDGSVILDANMNQIVIDKNTDEIIVSSLENTYIGTANARENLVLGKKLLKAINDLITILKTPLTPAIPGQVIASSAAILPLLTTWATTHTLTNPATSDLLAKKKFTE